ncbi:MAG: type II toxin-antitoxin system HicA family toxin [Burkholderiaceae bacterium]|nr:type II toxin-antitoxin system HicA family toxin [Burkholderiaceae bacterium]
MLGYTPKLKEILLAAGCYFKRSGKGDHEIWHSPVSGHSFPVDHHIKSRHMANAVLKQAGLPKHF